MFDKRKVQQDSIFQIHTGQFCFWFHPSVIFIGNDRSEASCQYTVTKKKVIGSCAVLGCCRQNIFSLSLFFCHGCFSPNIL